MGIAIYQTPLYESQQNEYLGLLALCGLRDEGDADIVALASDESGSLTGCGALAGHTLKQLAVTPEAEGQGVMASVLSALIGEAHARGEHRLFLCTKPDNRKMFSSMGFYTLISTEDALLMENRRDGLEDYLSSLPRYEGVCGSVVCNCDPFTLGHRHLIEYAASQCDHLYVFAVSESGSMFSPSERLEMIQRGTADIPDCHVFGSDLYLVSRATFPAYFIRDEEKADLVKSDLDIELFGTRIAPALNITKRFAGEEPYSAVTKAYNERMKELLPEHGIAFCEIPRYEGISAGKVRSLIRKGDLEAVREMVPETTYEIIQRKPCAGA
jgi:[citrate (pro-3S)-lyase] ligase